MSSSRHQYQPYTAPNLEAIKLQIKNLKNELDHVKKTNMANQRTNERQIEYFANFARHDIGNAIQTISATLKNLEGSIEENAFSSLTEAVKNLNLTLENFGKLIPVSGKNNFKLYQLINAIDIFGKTISKSKKIKFKLELGINGDTEIFQPYYPVFQVIQNLIINAQKACEKIDGFKEIKVIIKDNENFCVFKVMDNGIGIPKENLKKIFEYGFTTTKGSGIGLFHAKTISEEIGGELTVSSINSDYNTIFTFKFPKNGTQENSGN